MGGGPPRFPPNPTWWAVLTRPGHPALPAVAYGTLTPSGDPFQRSSADEDSVGLGARSLPGPPPGPSYPRPASAAACATGRVWALPLSLAATRGLLSLPRGTEMFQFPRFPPATPSRGWPAPGLAPGQVAPFGYPRITGCQRLPGAFRRVATPFLGPRRHRHPPCALLCRSPLVPVLPVLPRLRSALHRSRGTTSSDVAPSDGPGSPAGPPSTPHTPPPRPRPRRAARRPASRPASPPRSFRVR